MKVLLYDNSLLRTISTEVEDLSVVIDNIVDMKNLIISAIGVGLSAPQISISKRFFLVDVGYCEDPTTSRIEEFINPSILSHTEDTVDSREGCLSLPGVWAHIQRYSSVVLEWKNLNGETYIKEFNGLMSKIVQHEVDHLDGIYFTDRLSDTDKSKFKHHLKRIQRGLITPDYPHIKSTKK